MKTIFLLHNDFFTSKHVLNLLLIQVIAPPALDAELFKN